MQEDLPYMEDNLDEFESMLNSRTTIPSAKPPQSDTPTVPAAVDTLIEGVGSVDDLEIVVHRVEEVTMTGQIVPNLTTTPSQTTDMGWLN
jgi:hypothetical protein